jgi:hypothetical protein
MKYSIKNLCLTMLALLGLSANTNAQSFLTNGLVAYYPFSGNANDASGNGLNGTVSNATLTTDRFGHASSAYSFNGSSSFISINSSPLLELTTNLTISFWMKSTSVGGIILCKGNAEGSYSIGATASNAIGFNQQNSVTMVLSQSDAASNTWIQVVCTLNGTNATIYFNGQLNQVGTGVTLGTGTGALTIGKINSGLPSFYGGLLDDIRIYNRPLSANEVAQLYLIEGNILNIHEAVYVDDDYLLVGTNYQLQVSSDLNTWTNQGAAFTATNTYWRSTNYWDVTNWNQLYFRLVPQ